MTTAEEMAEEIDRYISEQIAAVRTDALPESEPLDAYKLMQDVKVALERPSRPGRYVEWQNAHGQTMFYQWMEY